MQRIFRKGVKKPYWMCDACGRRITDERLRRLFCDAFNRIVENRERWLPVWERAMDGGTALERLRAGQMRDVTAGGTILFEVPELTQAVLQEAWMEEDGGVVYRFLCGLDVYAH